MTKRFLLLLTGLLTFLLAACNSGNVEPEATLPVPPPSLTPAATTGPSYPGPVANTPIPDGYPFPTAPAAPVGYPDAAANLIWVIRPLGQQCVDPATYIYPDLSTAISALTDAGVAVLASEEIAMMVCEACDCPTSEHFRVQIYSADLAKVEPLGWIAEN
jgi:hypothetical protein